MDNIEILSKINELETILEVMPEDTKTIRSLIDLYYQNNNQDMAMDHAQSLGQILMLAGDYDLLNKYAQELYELDSDNPVFNQLHETAQIYKGLESETKEDSEEDAESSGNEKLIQEITDISLELDSEMELAWELKNSNVITMEQYEEAMTQLSMTHASSHEGDKCISIIIELVKINQKLSEELTNFILGKYSLPLINISDFKIDRKFSKVIPIPVQVRCGLIPFAEFNNRHIFVTLNPINERLLKRVKKLFDKPIVLYTTTSRSLEISIERLLESNQ